MAIDESTLPGNACQSFEQDGTYNGVVSVVLHDGSIVTNIDFGYYIPASVGIGYGTTQTETVYRIPVNQVCPTLKSL